MYSPGVDMRAHKNPFCMMRKGLKQASTFTGFCSYHDNQMFAPIEKQAIELTERNIFLLTYRSMARGFYVGKENNYLHMFSADAPILFDSIHGPIGGIFIEDPRFDEEVMRDLEVFGKLQNAYARGDYAGLQYFALELDSVPEILCSGMTNVEFDFQGNRLQSVTQEERQDLITLSLLPFKNKYGVALFAWYGKSAVNERLGRSLLSLPERDIPNAIVRFVFQYCENFFVAPKWWDCLSATVQERLLNRFESTMYFESLLFIDLGPDGMEYVDWKVTDIKTNLKL